MTARWQKILQQKMVPGHSSRLGVIVPVGALERCQTPRLPSDDSARFGAITRFESDRQDPGDECIRVAGLIRVSFAISVKTMRVVRGGIQIPRVSYDISRARRENSLPTRRRSCYSLSCKCPLQRKRPAVGPSGRRRNHGCPEGPLDGRKDDLLATMYLASISHTQSRVASDPLSRKLKVGHWASWIRSYPARKLLQLCDRGAARNNPRSTPRRPSATGGTLGDAIDPLTSAPSAPPYPGSKSSRREHLIAYDHEPVASSPTAGPAARRTNCLLPVLSGRTDARFAHDGSGRFIGRGRWCTRGPSARHRRY